MWRDPWFWHEETWAAQMVRTALRPLGALYNAVSTGRLGRTKTQPIENCAIICIGNASLGGVGKTPFAIALYRLLNDHLGPEHQIGFLTRGYGGTLAGPLRVDADQHTAQMVGDEALLLARYGPVWLARDRTVGAHFAARQGARCLISDDGYQNPNLPKDLSILLVPVPIPAQAAVFPAGPLREPVAQAARRADIIVFITEDGDEAFPAPTDQSLVRTLTADHLAGRAWLSPVSGTTNFETPMVGFCGIGNPDRFQRTLTAAGITLADFIAFPDHYPYNEEDLKALRARAKRYGASLITTQKDHVRVPEAFAAEVLVMPVAMNIECDGLIDHCLAVMPDRPHTPPR
ncbi:MAG: tetraacyldisaccharide 4'-kinase [Pseudomonadota bacterium]